MAHTYDSWLVTLKSGACVQFVRESLANEYAAGNKEVQRVEHIVKNSPCHKPHRGYCGLCYPYRLHGGNPDYTEGTEHIDAAQLET